MPTIWAPETAAQKRCGEALCQLVRHYTDGATLHELFEVRYYAYHDVRSQVDFQLFAKETRWNVPLHVIRDAKLRSRASLQRWLGEHSTLVVAEGGVISACREVPARKRKAPPASGSAATAAPTAAAGGCARAMAKRPASEAGLAASQAPAPRHAASAARAAPPAGTPPAKDDPLERETKRLEADFPRGQQADAAAQRAAALEKRKSAMLRDAEPASQSVAERLDERAASLGHENRALLEGDELDDIARIAAQDPEASAQSAGQ